MTMSLEIDDEGESMFWQAPEEACQNMRTRRSDAGNGFISYHAVTVITFM